MTQNFKQDKFNHHAFKPIVLYFLFSFLFLFFLGGLLYYEYEAQVHYNTRIKQGLALQSAALTNSQINQAFQRLRLSVVSGAIAIFLYLVLVGMTLYVVERNYLKPLRNLQKDVKRIISSNYNYKIKAAPNSQFGFLYDFLNLINDHFQETKIAMENAARQRGKDLDKVIGKLWKENLAMESKEIELGKLLQESHILQEQVKEEKDFVNAIINCMDEGLFTVNTEGNITFMNPSAEQILEVKAADAIGKNLEQIAPLYLGLSCEKRLPLLERPIMKSCQSGKKVTTVLSDDYCFLTKSGKKTAVVLASSPLLSDCKVIGAVATFRNVNVEKRLDEAKNGFISIASHQMRTPITSMRWFAEMLLAKDAGPLNKEQHHYVAEIYLGINRVTDLLNHLLQIARIEAGRVKIEPVAVDFKQMIPELAAELKPLFEEKKQKLVVTIKPDNFPIINMDKEMAWQVMLNLLSNASRYAPVKGVIKVNVKIESGMAEFSVSDKGIDIPKDSQDRIFNKFYRAPNAIKHVPEGSGLGLFLVKSLVEGWGGKAWFKSARGQGATFYFTVPLSGMEAKEGDITLKV